LGNIHNSDEEVELPNDILEALEKQDEGSKPNIEELKVVNLAEESEEPKEVKIGAHFSAEQKDELIALLKEFREIFAWSYQDMPGLDRHSGSSDSTKTRMQACEAVLRRMKSEIILKIKEEVREAIESRVPKHSNLLRTGWPI
jgi:hypothetical protein